MKQKRNSDSISWQPSKIGDSIDGIFEGFRPVGENGLYILLKDRKPVSFSSAIRNIITKEIALKLKEGKDKLRFVFTGTTKGKRGNDTKLFDVFLNGKKLESTFGRKATQEEIESFFK
jgi:hypothetical protein